MKVHESGQYPAQVCNRELCTEHADRVASIIRAARYRAGKPGRCRFPPLRSLCLSHARNETNAILARGKVSPAISRSSIVDRATFSFALCYPRGDLSRTDAFPSIEIPMYLLAFPTRFEFYRDVRYLDSHTIATRRRRWNPSTRVYLRVRRTCRIDMATSFAFAPLLRVFAKKSFSPPQTAEPRMR